MSFRWWLLPSRGIGISTNYPRDGGHLSERLEGSGLRADIDAGAL
jgi:hypothetical protein